MPADVVLKRMTVGQMRESMAASRLDPFPEERIEYMLALMIATILNKLRFDKDERQYDPRDFVPDYTATPDELERKRAERMQARMRMLKLKRELFGAG